MICKKCGAYNPDHATFCKVCAANLKDQDVEDVTEATDAAEEEVQETPKPRRGIVQAPDFSSMRRAGGSFRPAPRKEEAEEMDEDKEGLEREEENVKETPHLTRSAAPAKKRRVVDEDEDEEDEDDEYDEGETAAEKLESEPKTTRFARVAASSKKPRRVVEDEDDDEDEDEEYDDDGYDDGDDEYEEYEPTPPRRKNSSRKQSKNKSGGFSIVTLLIACLLVILLLIVGIIVFCNMKGGATQQRLPGFLQFNCAGKEDTSKNTGNVTAPTNVPASTGTEQQQSQQSQENAPVTGTEVDFSATELEEFINDKGEPSIRIKMYARPGEIITIVLPNQDDWVFQNNETTYREYGISIPKSCYDPNKPLDAPVYTVTPEIIVTRTDGTQESLHVDSFDLTFPTIQLELEEPAVASIPEEGIMAAEGNELVLKGTVDDHTVTVTVNGQPVVNMYEGGKFEYTYSMQTDEPEVVTIEASKANCVTSSYAFTVNPYVFIPEEMPLTVISDVTKLQADKNNKVTVSGTTAPGATLTATPAAEYQSSVACGSPTVDAEGNYSFEVTFDKNYYGIASITIHAKKDGYEEGETNCLVSRMYADRAKAISGYSKTKDYHEVPSNFAFDAVLSNPTDKGFYRFVGKVTAVDEETGIITFSAKTSSKETVTIYVLNASAKWEPAKHINGAYKLYCTLNGLYTDGTSLFVTAWFVMND